MGSHAPPTRKLSDRKEADRAPAAHLHLYGKSEPRPGRKMGHVTRVIR